MNEVLKFVYWYFAFNIDQVAGEKIENLTLRQLSGILEPMINRLKNYVPAGTDGEYKYHDHETKTTDQT